jgi:hypothetical protein
MNGDAERLPLPNQHEQPLAPRDSGVNQVALQQHVVLRGYSHAISDQNIALANDRTHSLWARSAFLEPFHY